MSISIDIYRAYICDPLGLYFFLVNNSIDPITLIGLYIDGHEMNYTHYMNRIKQYYLFLDNFLSFLNIPQIRMFRKYA